MYMEENIMEYKIIDGSELRNMLKEVVKEVIEEEMVKIRLMLVPYVSDEEQKEIKEMYKEPSKEIARSLNFNVEA